MMADLHSRHRLTSLIRVSVLPFVIGGVLQLASTAQAAVTLQYTFNTDVAALGSFSPTVGTAGGTLLGATTISGGALVLPGAGTGTGGDHARLTADGGTGVNIFNYTNASFAFWATTNDANPDDWERYFDIGYQNAAATGAENSVWVTSDAGGGDGLRAVLSNLGGAQFEEQISTTTVTGSGVGRHHVVAVFDATNDIGRLYLNGVQVAVNTAMLHNFAALDFIPAMMGDPDRPNFAFLGSSLYTADQNMEGSISQFEIHDTALTAAEADALFQAGPIGEAAPTQSRLTINRETGAMTLERVGTDLATVVGYSITSNSGALNQTAWLSITDNYDGGSGSEFDNGNWTELSASGSAGDFSEFTFEGDGGTLGATDIPIGSAGAWRQYYIEDVVGRFELSDGTNEDFAINWVGNDGLAYIRSDLDFDGDIDIDDWSTFLAGNGTVLAGVSDAANYAFGDINGDGVNNVADFRLFKADYTAYQLANPGGGAGLFAGEVPEPATMSLLAIALAGLLPRRGRRSAQGAVASAARQTISRRPFGRCLAALSALFALFAMLPGRADAVIIHRYGFNEAAGATMDGVTMIADSAGGAAFDGVVRGASGMLSGSQMTFPGGAQAGGGAYVDLPNGMISAIHTDATFEAWYTINSTVDDWTRVWDFGSSAGMEFTGPGAVNGAAGDTFFYAPLRGTNINTQRASIENDEMASLSGITGVFGGGSITSDPNVTTSVGIQQHVVVTYRKDNGSGLPVMTVFINGAQVDQDTGAAATAFQLENMNDVNNWLGRSNYNADNMFNGSINEVRIYDSLLSANDVVKDAILGPDTVGDLLSLEVNTTTGAVVMKNTLGVTFPDIDYYRVSSAGGALNSGGWASFDDGEGDGVGVGWDESGGVDATEVAEYRLVGGDSTFAATSQRSLGSLFNPAIFGAGMDGDLIFEIGTPAGALATGNVVYVSSPALFGDYNGDGTINAADYTVYRNCKAGILCAGGLPNEEPGTTPGTTTIEDYNYWKLHYGETAGSGASVGGGDVPEPASLVSLVFGMLIAGAAFARRRS